MGTTIYSHDVVVTVLDQFGNRLNAIYAGAAVTEHNLLPINQTMNANGTYIDPVGQVTLDLDAAGDPVLVRANSPEALAWPNQSPRPMQIVSRNSGSIPVQIGGNLLTVGIENRQTTTHDNTFVAIEWVQ